jgi:ABC-type lipoprotein release transport system permease subunit
LVRLTATGSDRRPLAKRFHLSPGDQVSLRDHTSDGGVDEQPFVVRGIYSTRTPAYDENTVFMSLVKAQAIARAANHASLIFVLLDSQEQAAALAAALESSELQVKTWQQLNELTVQLEDFANAYMYVFYLIILGITATVVTNTLVMAVYERTREIGVLRAIGMRARRIMIQYLTEATLLATGGVIGGPYHWTTHHRSTAGSALPFRDLGYGSSGGIYPYLVAADVVNLTITAYVITLTASLYPALVAARMEPAQALHAH